jgi:catechol 2,3-dioxygenase-like lactoylglutathione lyase family enzyme
VRQPAHTVSTGPGATRTGPVAAPGLQDCIAISKHVQEMVAWYARVLEMPSGARPNFPFPGAWLYADGHPTVHLNGVDKVGEQSTDLTLEHFAFKASGLKAFVARLTDQKERFEVAFVPGAPIVQINVWDPDGNHIHIDFAAAEAEGVDLPKPVMFNAAGKLAT